MADVYTGVTPQRVKELMEQIEGHAPERDIVLLKAFPTTVSAPTKTGKYKGLHRLKFEVYLDEDAIVGPNALTDFGAIMMMHIPKKRLVKLEESE